MKVGYGRTSTLDQQAGFDAQIRDLTAAGCEKIFSEQVSAVGKRPQLEAVLEFIREGDTLTVTWREFKVNPQKCGRAWVLDGAPAEPSPGEHHVITERLAPWRNDYRVASPERQQAICRWLEQQQL